MLDKLRRLTWREGLTLLAAMVLLPLTAVLLRVAGFRSVCQLAAGPPVTDDGAVNPVIEARVRDTAQMVAAAAQYGPYRASCLPQSLVLQWMLRTQGVPTQLQIGVSTVAPDFAAHAWLEYRGTPLIDSPAVHDRFAVFERAASRGPR